jgi:hypothetical protein
VGILEGEIDGATEGDTVGADDIVGVKERVGLIVGDRDCFFVGINVGVVAIVLNFVSTLLL